MLRAPKTQVSPIRASSLGLIAVLVWASPALAQVESDTYFTERSHEVLGLQDFDWDSGWVPGGSPIQVRFTAHAGNTVYVAMDGDGSYDWDTQTIDFEGALEGGVFDLDFGLDLQSQVQFDILGLQWVSDLFPPVTYGVFEDILFDPYLLPGQPQRPAILETSTPQQTLLDVPLGIDLVVASGNFQLDVAADVYAELEGNSILVESPEASAIVDAWDLAFALGADPTSPLDVWATLEAYLYWDITVHLYPTVVLTVLGQDFTLAQIDIPVPLPSFDDIWVFDPVALHFAAPPPPEPEKEEGDDDDSADGGTWGTGEGEAEVDATTFSECSCATTGAGAPGRGHTMLGLGLILGLGLRARSRRRGHQG